MSINIHRVAQEAAFNAGWEVARGYQHFLDEHGNPARWAWARKIALGSFKKKVARS